MIGVKWVDGVPQIPEGSAFIVESKDWHDGRGFAPTYVCSSLEQWKTFKATTLEGGHTMDMSFRVKDASSGRVLDSWVYC
tara:strand:- start:377 stop:616 length:240 start_codon:yes stop_codon:yes gene_type:complete